MSGTGIAGDACLMRRLILLVTVLAFPAVAFAQEGDKKAAGAAKEQSPAEVLFMEKGAGCHSIGKGKRMGGGPDLKGVHERPGRDDTWLHNMIKTPDKWLASDPIARKLAKEFAPARMTDLGLTDKETTDLIKLIKKCSPNPDSCNLTGSFRALKDEAPQDLAEQAEKGRKLFLGLTPFANDGPPCVSCHTVAQPGTMVAGGSLFKRLRPDTDTLTTVSARFPDDALDAALRSPTFRLMKEIYAEHKLTADETFALRAFLAEANRTKVNGVADTYTQFVPGLLFAAFLMFLLHAIWSRRLQGVRKPLAPIRTQGSAS